MDIKARFPLDSNKSEVIIMYQNCCKKCGSISLHTEVKGNNVGLYCDDCGSWIKWLSKDELRAFEHAAKEDKKDVIECEIPLGKLCCFKPLDSDAIYFGYMAGKVIDDFENMTFMYVLMCDDRYFFSRNEELRKGQAEKVILSYG